jgi:hypothetical protein
MLRHGVSGLTSVPWKRSFSDLLYVPHRHFNHSWFVYQSSMANSSRHTKKRRRETFGGKTLLILPAKYVCHTPQGSLACRKILRHGTDGFTSLRRKSCCGFLSPLKIHRPRPSLNPRTLGPMTSTIIIKPPRATLLNFSLVSLFNTKNNNTMVAIRNSTHLPLSVCIP